MAAAPPVNIPRVARGPRPAGAARIAAMFAVAGGVVFASLAHGRAADSAQTAGLPPLNMAAATAPPEPLPVAGLSPPPPSPPAAERAEPVPASAYRIRPAFPRRSDGAAAESARARRNAPALIVDVAQTRAADGPALTAIALGDGGAAATIPTAALNDPASAATSANDPAASSAAAAVAGAAVPSAGLALAGSGGGGARDGSADERFAARAGDRETAVSRAYRLPNQDTLVPLGTVVGAVMETALNSDVPGFARAITTRDVLSFDGSQVVIPAGSHVVGEYKSGVAQGASRIFIVWTRLVRPDGVAIALASPATDDLGGGGVGGKVSRHFLERFGGAVLLSVLTGGLNAFTQSLARGSTVVVSSSTEATSLAGEASRGTDIPPTIKTRQGAAVRIFVARDLDFSGVGPAL